MLQCSGYGNVLLRRREMRNIALIGLAILIVASLATGILPAFAASTDPQPGYTYYVVYNQTDGSIVTAVGCPPYPAACTPDRKSTRLNSSHLVISYAVFCLKKKKKLKLRMT